MREKVDARHIGSNGFFDPEQQTLAGGDTMTSRKEEGPRIENPAKIEMLLFRLNPLASSQ